MKCQFDDGLTVNYAGTLRISQGDRVNVYVKEGLIPNDIRNSLDEAVRNNSCDDVRKVAETVTDRVGTRACIHEEEKPGW